MSGSIFTSGSDVVDGEVAKSSFYATYTTEQYPLGTIREQMADEVTDAKHTDGTSLGLKGDRTWMFVQTGVAVDIYDCCVKNAIATPLVVKPTAGAGDLDYTVSGVAQNAIANGSYGWIVIRGECVVNGAAGITAGQYLDTNGAASAGQVDDSTVTDTLIATALTATDAPVTGTVAARVWLP
tara:strand:- start:9307 stop:9852 length:546 start_codon:yes stop_codon:yes gene_type:complete